MKSGHPTHVLAFKSSVIVIYDKYAASQRAAIFIHLKVLRVGVWR